MRGAARDGRLGRGDRLEWERQEIVQIGGPMEPGALNCVRLARHSWYQRRGNGTGCSPTRGRDRVRDTRELPGREQEEANADPSWSTLKLMFRVTGSSFDRLNAIYLKWHHTRPPAARIDF